MAFFFLIVFGVGQIDDIMVIKNAETLAMGDILSGNLTRDLADFNNYAQRFDQAYVDAHRAKILAFREAKQPKVLRGQNKKFTRDLYKKVDGLRGFMRTLEGYVKHAGKKLDVTVKDFGISKVRKKVKSKDLEGLGEALSVLIENITHNLVELLDEGYTNQGFAELKDRKDEIDKGNAKQELNKSAMKQLAQKNRALLKEVVAGNNDILDVGKRIYKDRNQAKYKQYVFGQLLEKWRNE